MFPFDDSCFFDPIYNIAKIIAIAAATTATQRWTGGVWSTVRIGAGAQLALGHRRSQPVRRSRPHRRRHHRHSKVDRRRVRSTVRIGAGARPAGGRRHSQPVRRNRRHRRHHHRHKGGQAACATVDRCGGAAGRGSSSFAQCAGRHKGWADRSTVQGAGARPASGHRCHPARGLVLGHHGHRVAKGARAELRARRLGTATPHGQGHVQGQLACTKATD
jgi:hypothetical protein